MESWLGKLTVVGRTEQAQWLNKLPLHCFEGQECTPKATDKHVKESGLMLS